MVPKPVNREMQFLDAPQLVELIAAAPDEHRLLIATLGLSGIRWGEAASLRRRRCHVLERRLHIAESVTEVGGHLVYGTTKSARDRWVHIPEFLADDFARRLAVLGSDPEALVFTTTKGQPLRNSNFRNRTWKPMLQQTGLPTDLRIHDLRHTAASLMIAEGAPITVVQRQLGHSSVVVTQRYSHLYPSQGEELGARLHERFEAARGDFVGREVRRVIPIAG